MFAGAAFFGLFGAYRGTRANPARIVRVGGFIQGGFSVLLLMPTIGMKMLAAAVTLSLAASAFLLGAAGIRRTPLYVLGAACTVATIALLLILAPGRVDPMFAAIAVVPALLLAWLAKHTPGA